mgnify:CR=1 FL=1
MQRWTALDALGDTVSCVSDVLFRLGRDEYLVCVPHDRDLRRIEGKRFVTTVMWAETEGAARRAQLMDIESDERGDVLPPPALLLSEGASSYGSIVDCLQSIGARFQESASYRIGSDGAFIHRSIIAPPRTFHFRNRDDDDKDRCYAIKYVLPDEKQA